MAGGDQTVELARLRSENARLNSYVAQLQQDLGNAKEHSCLFASFNYEETKALVEYGVSLQGRRREDAHETRSLISDIGRQRARRNTILGRFFRKMSDRFYIWHNRFS